MTTCLNCGHENAAGFLYCPQCGTKAPESGEPGDSLIGRTLNKKYRVMTEIGAGAMGTVYLGEHVGLKKKVALKVLHPDLQLADESLQRFQREGIAAGKFTHPNAIQIFDFDKGENDTLYLAMEFVEGSNLKVFLRRKGRLPVATSLRLIRQILSVLSEAHRHGIIHRDLKPDNIMVTTGTRGELRIKVLDFGLSKLVDLSLDSSLRTVSGRIMGTPLYMSPEQCAGEEADERSDLYAAGLILYEMLAGFRPFQDESTTELILTRTTKEAPSLLAEHPDIQIPEELDLIIHKALERRREDRYQHAEDVLTALDSVPESGGSAATTTSATRTQLAIELHRKTVEKARSLAENPPVSKTPFVIAAIISGLVLVSAFWFVVLMGSVFSEAEPARVRLVAPGDRSEVQAQYVKLLDTANAGLRTHDVNEAQSSIERAMTLECRDAEAFVVRARIYRQKRDDDPALAALREARRMDPAYVEPILAMGWIQFDRDELEEARATFLEAGELVEQAEPADGPDARLSSGEVMAGLGAIAYSQGAGDAEETLSRAAVLAPGSVRAQLYLGRLRLDGGDLDGAIEALVQAKLSDARAWRAYAWLAEAYSLDGRYEEAESQLREAVERNPGAIEVREALAAMLLDRERVADALAFLDESTRRYPEAGRLQVLRGVVLDASGRTDEAVTALERGVRRLPEDVRARLLLGVLYHREGRLDDAIAQYEAAREVDAERPSLHLNLGLAYFASERVPEAVGSFERAVELDPESPTAYYNLGALYKDYVGDAERAADYFELYKAAGGRDSRVDAWLRQQ